MYGVFLIVLRIKLIYYNFFIVKIIIKIIEVIIFQVNSCFIGFLSLNFMYFYILGVIQYRIGYCGQFLGSIQN